MKHSEVFLSRKATIITYFSNPPRMGGERMCAACAWLERCEMRLTGYADMQRATIHRQLWMLCSFSPLLGRLRLRRQLETGNSSRRSQAPNVHCAFQIIRLIINRLGDQSWRRHHTLPRHNHMKSLLNVQTTSQLVIMKYY